MALAKRGVVIIISKTIPTAEEAEIAGFHVVYIPLQPFRLLPVFKEADRDQRAHTTDCSAGGPL